MRNSFKKPKIFTHFIKNYQHFKLRREKFYYAIKLLFYLLNIYILNKLLLNLMLELLRIMQYEVKESTNK